MHDNSGRRRESAPDGDDSLDRAHAGWAADPVVLRGMEYLIALSAGILSVDAAPLYALLAATNQALEGRPSYSAVLASAQFAFALEHLGFNAELIPACTTLVHQNGTDKIDVGVWERPPVMRNDGVTDGHLVVWVDSLKRLIDLGLCNQPMLLKLSSDEKPLTNPIVLPIAGGRKQLFDTQGTTLRPPFGIFWTFFPHWMPRFEFFFHRHATAIEDGGLALVDVTVGLLSALVMYGDLSGFDQLFPQLAARMEFNRSMPEGNNAN
jgi:hypothetical protein